MRMKIFFATAASVLLSASAFAANFNTSVTQGVGQNWNGAIWVPEGGGTAVAPTAGNSYFVNANAVTIKNLSANARIRNPTAAGTHIFPGAELTIRTNAEFRFKTGTGLGPLVFTNLVMDGGVWNIADAFVPTVTGRV